MEKLLNFLNKHDKKIMAGLIAVYILTVSLICIWKYHQLLYNGLDLAIYNNALWNTAHGHWFWSSIQGHNYFGDHFEPILILLLPLYYLWQSPIVLLILQTIFLSAAAWPLHKISLFVLSSRDFEAGVAIPSPSSTFSGIASSPVIREGRGPLNDRKKLAGLGIAFLWLINPLVHNVNLFEFHAIAFLPFFFFCLFYFYLRIKQGSPKKLFLCFYVFMFLCLMIREDVAFVMLTFLIMIGISALKNKNKFLLRITGCGLLITVLYLVFSFKIIALLSPAGFSPFGYYYGWLGQNPSGIFRHILTLTNLEMVLGLLAPFLFLPLIKPRYLGLAIIPLGQIILSAAGGGALIWQIHYGALFLPALTLAFLYGFKKANSYAEDKLKSKYLLISILIIFNLGLWPSFGPFFGDNDQMFNNRADKSLLKKIEPAASALASYEFLPDLSGRQEIYALNYFFLGKQQFGAADYGLSDKPEYVLINFDDLIGFDLHLANLNWSAKYYPAGAGRLRELLKDYGIVALENNVVLLKKNYQSDKGLYIIRNKKLEIRNQKSPASPSETGRAEINNIAAVEYIFDNKIKLTNYGLRITDYPPTGDPPSPNSENSHRKLGDTLQLSLTFEPLKQLDKDYLIILNDGVNKKILAMAYGLYPTSQWQVGEEITVNYELDYPAINRVITLTLGKIRGGMEIGAWCSTKIAIDKIEKLGESYELKID